MTEISIPIAQPSSTSIVPPQSRLSDSESAKYDKLLTELQRDTHYTDSERMWLSKECLLRYLRASKWNIVAAKSRLQATLRWRREWNLDAHTPDYISPENETGKQVICGFDNQGRPLLYLFPQRQNTKDVERQMQHLVFMLERCIDLMPPGQENLVLLINYQDSRKADSVGLKQGRQTLNILQNHYPERLGRAIIQHVPWLLWGFFKAISPFIDPATRDKMLFDDDATPHVPSDQLFRPFGGQVDFVYDHAVYWPALNALAEERRRERVERWKAGGCQIGLSEA